MIQFSYENIFENLNNKIQINSANFENQLSKFDIYYSGLKSRVGNGFLELPFEKNLSEIKYFAEKFENFENVVWIGIGGSALGSKLIHSSFRHSKLSKKVYFLENVDPDEIENVFRTIYLENTLFVVVTKSGSTPETIATWLFFQEKLIKYGLDWKKQVLFITDPDTGWLRNNAKENNIPTLPIPSSVGGRWSVLTPVGLFLGALMKLDIEKFLEGAAKVLTDFENKVNADAFKLSILQLLLWEKGVNITTIFPYSAYLKTLSAWYVQLLSESLGKKVDRNGKVINFGLTPMGALGTTDQHSALQLFVEGPSDKLFLFVEVNKFHENLKINETAIEIPKFSFLNGKTFNNLMQAEQIGTQKSLIEANKPTSLLSIDMLNEYSLGEIIMFLELSVGMLGEMLNINVFDQPGVERSKILSKEILESM